ncbi:MAG: sulfotransferase [Gammaproteobacteria bacterium]|nr:sulfotransferase [Gammaproteobacteria bacterium]
MTHLKPNKTTSNYRHIFLISHMRANTSLISHILGSHPQICGYYEMHLNYLTENDLLKQEKLLFENTEFNNETEKNKTQYLFDKLLHNDYELLLENLVPKSEAFESTKKLNILVSIRPPEQTIKSIVNLFRNKKEQRSYADPVNATKYYIERLKKMALFCKHHKNNFYYYDADLIRTHSEESLKHIQSWLSLSTPLTENYQVFSLTGRPRIGDSSENMKKGTIVKQQTNYDEIEIPTKLLQEVTLEAEKYRHLIISHAIDSMTF